jgi:hypothetical protein
MPLDIAKPCRLLPAVVGYIADAANSGLPVDWGRLAQDAGLSESAAGGIQQGALRRAFQCCAVLCCGLKGVSPLWLRADAPSLH